MINKAELELGARRRSLRQTLVPAWAVLACVLFLLHAPSGIRAPVAIVFFCFIPGAALIGLFNMDSVGIELSLAVALSLALSGLTAGILLYGHLWSPTAVVVTVTVISVAGGLRDIRLGRRRRQAASSSLAPLPDSSRARMRGLPAAARQTAQRLGGQAGSLSGGVAAVPRLASRGELDPPRQNARQPQPEPSAGPLAAASPLQGFLLDELRQRTVSPAPGKSSRQPSSLTDLEPRELSELLSWSSLQRYVTQRALREMRPELWFVQDLERQFGSQPHKGHLGHGTPGPRGVWLAGISAGASIPVAWRVLKDDGKKEWRTRLALEMIDALPQPGLAGAAVAADTDYGSLAGFRRGLITRGLSYLIRVDPLTAARALNPHRASRSAAEAKDLLATQIAAQPKMQAAPDGSGLVLVKGTDQILICEVPAAGSNRVFWLSNLPAETAPERFALLVQLASRGAVERATANLLQVALKMAAEEGTGLDRELALIALAEGLQTLNSSSLNEEQK